MNKSVAFLCFILFSLGSFQSLRAGKIEKGFEALSIYNYFKAKEIFEKRFKRDSVASAYGLSLIYGRNDNPFYQLDSAYKKICIAERYFPKLDERKREKFNTLGVDSVNIQAWKDTIDYKYFKKIRRLNQLKYYEAYINRHLDSDWQTRAVRARDSIVFYDAEKENSSTAYFAFMQSYSASTFYIQAKNKYEERKFAETVSKGGKEDYQYFIKNNTSSPYLERAQDSVYAKYTPNKTIQEYDLFIRENPKNPNTSVAWRNIYRLFTSEYSPSRIVEFQIDYPNYPFKDELKVDLSLANKQFLPYANSGKWGFMDETGKVMIAPKYDFVESFSEGLAMCFKNGKVGFINKSEEVIIPFEYDDAEPFQKGISIVEKNGFYGMINRTNQFLLPSKYDYIGELASNLLLIEENLQYGFANKEGDIVVAPVYEYASDFKNGFALIEKEGRKGIIDSKAQEILPLAYSWLELPNEYGVIRAKKDSLFGLIKLTGEEVLAFEYEQIGSMNSGLALIRSAGKYGYCNDQGGIVVPIKYEFLSGAILWGEYDQGYAKYMRKGKFGIVDSLGEEIVPAIFENIQSYNDSSLFPVKKRGKWGYSNPALQLKVPYDYQFAEDFQEGFAVVKSDTAYGVIDMAGKWVIKPMYSSINRKGSFFVISKFGKIGIMKKDLTLLLEEKYDKIEWVKENYLRLTDGEDVYYFSIVENKFIKPLFDS